MVFWRVFKRICERSCYRQDQQFFPFSFVRDKPNRISFNIVGAEFDEIRSSNTKIIKQFKS
ncbi:hypothetical protein OA90_17320 [Labrenzia sp. OB1]|nr:hypothetical protein OA90_17320 [Labrenzia sp. OB1]